MRLSLILAAAPLALLAACSGGDDAADQDAAIDPATGEALSEDLASDPDLARGSEGNAALGGSGSGSLPRIDTSPEAIEAARDRAYEMIGGEDALRRPGQPRELAGTDNVTAAMRQAAQAAVEPGGQDCAARVGYTTAWAAKLPGAFPVYPRASTQEAAGTDEGACNLRIVTFRTPVPLDEVLAFYTTRAQAAGFGSEYVRASGDNILSGTKGRSAYVVYGRRLPEGLTEIDLVTSMQ
ncbi:hypothetical protein [Qipengyuania sp. MTN3-11]|uniref:hypothetical protein n=1 Tax=Qipengyuania sp. MTN3-11 TaxID=3056557 RepID=UPI0036F27FCF